MKALPARSPLAFYWEANLPVLSALYRNAIMFLGFFGLCALYIFPAKFQFGPFENNVFIPSGMVILGCLSLLGKKALVATPFDYLFLAWLILAILSHIFANEVLFRTIPQVYLQTNLIFILTLAITYRAFFCMTLLAPEIGSKMFLVASLFTSGVCILLAITQKFGPGKSLALRLGMQLSIIPAHVKDGVDLGRPTGVFDNPNVLGYVSCLFAALVMGWALSDIRNTRPMKTVGVLVLLSFSLLGVLTVQSRENAILLCLLPIVYGFLVARHSINRKNLAIVIAAIALLGFGFTAFIGASKSTYLTSVTHKGIKSDQSLQARADELHLLSIIAEDIAPLGSGQSAANMTNHALFGGYSYFDSKGIDAEWGNIYLAFGVWGPLLFVWLYIIQGRTVRFVLKLDIPEARMMAMACLFLLFFNLMLTVAAVRIDKYETGLFTFQMLGTLSAWWMVRKQKLLAESRL